ncbi:Wzz/FepE/Etk N-terminal domain-containing protein [Bowmanella denitrificans]|uniref:Wzz/FepE/Etk N-terminal domain-containing protein n=1 Tax=Bowmanella denitrificans TaxID=366582 RepID=A0ABP3GVH4_9ALTE
MAIKQENMLLKIGIGEFCHELIRRWTWVAASGIAVGIVFGIFAWTTYDTYRADVLLVPNSVNDASGLSAMASQFGGLANLAGLSIPQAKDKTTLALQVLESRQFLNEFARNRNLEVPLIAVKGWNKETDTAIYDLEKFDPKTNTWLKRQSGESTYYPTTTELYLALMRLIEIEYNKTEQTVSISFVYYEKHRSKQYLDWLISDLNENMRNAEVLELQRTVDYLTEKAESASNVDIQTSFYRIIEERLKAIALASVRLEYVLKTIDPAITPEEKYAPKRALIVVLGVLVGSLFGSCGICISIMFRR